MNCEQAREQLPDYLTRELDQTATRELETHLAACAWCREEAGMWERLSALPEEQPGPELRQRFDAMLAAYREGVEHAAPVPLRRSRFALWLESWWPAQPAFQFSIAMGSLVVGLAAGHVLFPSGGSANPNPELASLRREVRDTRELVTLSLLQQQSAGERLRGVTYSYRVEHADTDVLKALFETLNYDVSPDVRLAAVDALRRFGKEATVRRGLRATLATQESPLVQIAVIDALVDMHEREAAGALRQLQQNARANDTVRQRAAWALEKLK
jgi:hypothetical protein